MTAPPLSIYLSKLYDESRNDYSQIESHNMSRILHGILARPRRVVFLFLLITAPFGYFYTQQQFLNNLDIFFPHDDPGLIAYKNFQRKYGNDETALILVSGKSVFANEPIHIIRNISEMLKESEYVQRVFSITEEEEPVGVEDGIEFRRTIPAGRLNHEQLEKIRIKVLGDENLVKNLVSADGTTAIILMELAPIPSDEERHRALQEIRKNAVQLSAGRVRLRFSGMYIDDEMYTFSGRDYRIFTPVTLLIIFVVTLALIRSVSLSLLSMLNLGVILIWSMGMFTLCGEAINMVTTVIAPILMAVSIADAIHLLFHYQDMAAIERQKPVTAVQSTVEAVWLPCLFTSITTAIGFLSFIVSNVRPPRIVGIYTAIGVLIAFFVTMVFLPAVLSLLSGWLVKKRSSTKTVPRPVPTDVPAHKTDRFSRIVVSFGTFAIDRYKSISLLFFLIIGVSVIGIFNIRFETNISSYLPDTSMAKQDLDFLREKIGGYSDLEVLVQARSRKVDFTHPESLRLVDAVKQELLRKLPLTAPLSIAEYFKKMNRAFNGGQSIFYQIPSSRMDVLDFYELGDPEILDRLVSGDRMETRISVRFMWASTEKAKEILDRVEALLNEKINSDYNFVVNGRNKLYIQMVTNLKSSQLRSFASAFCLIFIVMLFICKNAKLALLSMIPNLFPILTTLGIMGLYDIPLNVTNIMIASVTIGIAVDDTIHFIVWFRRSSMSGMSVRNAILSTFKMVGKPLVTTTLVLCLGFFILLLGSITPTRTFGLLTGMSLFFALAADLLFLPPLILLFGVNAGSEIPEKLSQNGGNVI